MATAAVWRERGSWPIDNRPQLTKLPHKGAVLHYRFCSPSQIVREGIRVLESCYGQGTGQRIVGLGKFSSGVRDLGSNKRHLKGFGR